MKDSNSSQPGELKRQFVELLTQLTEEGRAEWATSSHEPGFAYCVIGEDLIVFEIRGGTEAALTSPENEVAGIVSKCRNASYLWLEGLDGWDELLKLLRAAPNSDAAFVGMRRRAQSFPVGALKIMASKELQ